MKKVSEGIGVMSGTSLDGIDLAWCRFEKGDDGKWNYRIEKATNVPYSDAFKTRLANAPYLSALEYVKLNNDVAEIFVEAINRWLGDGPKPDFIASHGHRADHANRQRSGDCGADGHPHGL